MKAYLTHISPRPGCRCCPSKDAHKARAKRHYQSVMAGKRNGKRSMRQRIRKETELELLEHVRDEIQEQSGQGTT